MSLQVEKNILLSRHTTLKVGGSADEFVEVNSLEDLKEAVLLCGDERPLVIGGGSNLFVGDNGYKGLVIKNSIHGVSFADTEGGVLVSCGAGVNFDDLVRLTVQRGLWGLENLSHIPGTVGATPIQNVGAYGVEVASLVVEVRALHVRDGLLKTFSNEECGFGYRDSFFKTNAGKNWIIYEVVFRLSREPRPVLDYGSLTDLKSVNGLTPEAVRSEVIGVRAGKFPDWKVIGTAGSFFKNPIVSKEKFIALQNNYPEVVGYELDEELVKLPLGMILDKICNLKGYCDNGVCLYEKQALVLVNVSAANAQAIDDFAKYVEMEVKQKTGLTIEREVSCV